MSIAEYQSIKRKSDKRAANSMSKVTAMVMTVLMAVNFPTVPISHVESFTSPHVQHTRQLSQRNHFAIAQFQIKTSSSLQAASLTLPNPLKQLPWNVQRERERELRRNKIERSKIFRQIGIAEDATYEEIVEATDKLILAAGNNLKQKIQVEIMKDQILQHRLNERLNGLLAQERNTNKEARAMSNYELEG
jgi:hypothetical protein